MMALISAPGYENLTQPSYRYVKT